MDSQNSEEVPLPMPAPLRTHMEDECFWILSQHKLLKLPRKPNVEDLLRQFYYHSIATPTEDTSPALLAEVLDGIKIYFDFMTEDHLLYSPEREQFQMALNRTGPASNKPKTATNTLNRLTAENSTPGGNPWQPNQPKPQLEPATASQHPSESQLMPSHVYGAEHLLRLFLKFPRFLCRAQLPSAHVQLLHNHFKDLLTYLSSRRTQLFSEDNYEDPDGSQDEVKPETPTGGEEESPPTSATPTIS